MTALGGVRLRDRGRPWVMDVAVAVAVAVSMLLGSGAAALGDLGAAGLRPLDTTGYLLVGAAGMALAFRRAAPNATFALTLVLGLAYQAVGYPGGPDPAPIVLALFSLAVLGYRLRALGLGLLASVLLVGIRALVVPDGLFSPLVVAFPTFVVAALFAGQMIASRRSARADLAREAAELERFREQDTQRRVDAERLRIARELHDVVAHTISLINVQATMGVHLMPSAPEKAADALGEIKQASRQALRELRRILDVLRSADEDEPTAPAPGLAELDTLVDSTTRAGLPLHLRILGTPHQVPATVDTAAYRIVQESLTNALRYAGDAPTQVTISYQPTCVRVEVVDTGTTTTTSAPQGTGHGIVGMRERATAVGGTLHAGPGADGGFAVRAELPLDTVLP